MGVSMVVIMEATAETACSPLMRPLRIISRTTITAGLEPANTAVSNKTWLINETMVNTDYPQFFFFKVI